MEDSRIVDLYLSRDESAIRATQGKYGKKIRGFARHICGDDTAAEECENDTYLGAWNSIPPHEPRTYLYAFLLKITRMLAIDHIRKATRQKRGAVLYELSSELEELIIGNDNVEAEIDAQLLMQYINDFLREQPEENCNIFIRRYWFMDSVSEVASRFSMSENKVKVTLFRMRNRLKKYLEKEGYYL